MSAPSASRGTSPRKSSGGISACSIRRNSAPPKALAIATRDGRFEAEDWRIRKDGTRFFASVVIDAIRGDDGETRRAKRKGGAEAPPFTHLFLILTLLTFFSRYLRTNASYWGPPR